MSKLTFIHANTEMCLYYSVNSMLAIFGVIYLHSKLHVPNHLQTAVGIEDQMFGS